MCKLPQGHNLEKNIVASLFCHKEAVSIEMREKHFLGIDTIWGFVLGLSSAQPAEPLEIL
jgi:hypothetical protein